MHVSVSCHQGETLLLAFHAIIRWEFKFMLSPGTNQSSANGLLSSIEFPLALAILATWIGMKVHWTEIFISITRP